MDQGFRTGDSVASDETLAGVFASGLDIHRRVLNSDLSPSSEEFQHDVRKGILLLEDATRMVSLLDVFSRNEDVGDLTTESLKYFLLPVLLGDLNAKLDEGHDRRMEVIKVVETYYLDFLNRVKDYGIVKDLKIPKILWEEDSPSENARSPGHPNLAKMNAERDEKMKRYKEKKELEAKVEELKALLDPNNRQRDEENVRNYYLNLIKSFVLECLDEISSYEMEKPILAHMAKIKKGEIQPEPPKEKRRPLKPIIITKDKIQKEVFGMGYKNLPILSIEEFYEQRVRDGWFPDPAASKKNGSLMDQAMNPELQKLQEEEEERMKEEKEENDDEEELARKRAMDDYKDTHKRGEGNRYNKG